MALTRSEFDGGKWSVARPNDTADKKILDNPNWTGALKAEVRASNCSVDANDRKQHQEDMQTLVFKPLGSDGVRFSVEAHAKSACDTTYPALSVFDGEHRLIVEFDNKFKETRGPAFGEGGDTIKYNRLADDSGDITGVRYEAQLQGTTNTPENVSIRLMDSVYSQELSHVVIDGGSKRTELIPTKVRLANPEVQLPDPSGPLPDVFVTGSFSDHPNIGILHGAPVEDTW